VRAFRAVGGTPRFIARAQGPYIFDAEGTRYIDYIGSWGPMILGHGHPAVLEAVQKAAIDGFSFGAPTEREIELAEEILSLVPSMDQLRLVSSGTEAAMSALRLARGATGRSKIIKFEGCYHGHADALLVKAGSGLATFGTRPAPACRPRWFSTRWCSNTTTSSRSKRRSRTAAGRRIACVVIEPIAGNMNFVRASVPFMKRLRELCTQHGSDAGVRRGDDRAFRVALGQRAEPVRGAIPGFAPDISVFGKVIGGGMPLAAFGGEARRDAAACAARAGLPGRHVVGQPGRDRLRPGDLREIRKPGFFDALLGSTRTLLDGLLGAAPRGRRADGRRLRGRHVRLLLRERAARDLQRGDGDRQGALQPLLPRDAGPRRVLRAGDVRGRLRQQRACARRPARHRGRRARRPAHLALTRVRATTAAYSAAVFDMDGLLLDSERPVRAAWMQVAADLGVALTPAAYLDLIGRNHRDSTARLRAIFGRRRAAGRRARPRRAAAGRALRHAAVRRQARRAQVARGAARRAHPVRGGVVDPPSGRSIGAWRGPGCWTSSARCAVATRVAHGKPAPDIYLLAVARLGVEARTTLAFEDSGHGALAAIAAGLGVVVVPDLKPPEPAWQSRRRRGAGFAGRRRRAQAPRGSGST
jgi:glutamate-1-semialdehyde 2,1-aminomutase